MKSNLYTGLNIFLHHYIQFSCSEKGNSLQSVKGVELDKKITVFKAYPFSHNLFKDINSLKLLTSEYLLFNSS